MANVGAWILGRNMFASSRGPWPDDSWRGWWGENPRHHTPVYVLTSYPRGSIVMKGGSDALGAGRIDPCVVEPHGERWNIHFRGGGLSLPQSVLHVALDHDCKGAPLSLSGRGIGNGRTGVGGRFDRSELTQTTLYNKVKRAS